MKFWRRIKMKLWQRIKSSLTFLTHHGIVTLTFANSLIFLIFNGGCVGIEGADTATVFLFTALTGNGVTAVRA